MAAENNDDDDDDDENDDAVTGDKKSENGAHLLFMPFPITIEKGSCYTSDAVSEIKVRLSSRELTPCRLGRYSV